MHRVGAARAPGLRDDSTDATVDRGRGIVRGFKAWEMREGIIDGKETMPEGWEAGAALKG